MGIYRCNKCGHLEEQPFNPNANEMACRKCQTVNRVYDTVFFTQKLLERYFAVNRELQALKEAEEGEEAQQSASGQNLLNGVNLSETGVLATEKQHEPLARWFLSQKIVPEFDYSAVDMSGYYDEAAEMLGSKYALFKDILNKIGWAYRNNHSGISLDLGKMSQKDGQAVNNLCRRFYSHTLFAKYFYKKQEKVIHLSLQRATAIKHFFSGGWLEWFALGKVLEEAAKKGSAYQFSCGRNVKIEFGNEDKHELDIVFLTRGKRPVLIECKSGEFRRDIEKYVRLKKRFELPSENFLILVADLAAPQATALSSMYELTFVTPETLSAHLKKLM